MDVLKVTFISSGFCIWFLLQLLFWVLVLFGLVLVWFWFGFGLVLVWFWFGFGLVLVWLILLRRGVVEWFVDWTFNWLVDWLIMTDKLINELIWNAIMDWFRMRIILVLIIRHEEDLHYDVLIFCFQGVCCTSNRRYCCICSIRIFSSEDRFYSSG